MNFVDNWPTAAVMIVALWVVVKLIIELTIGYLHHRRESVNDFRLSLHYWGKYNAPTETNDDDTRL